MEGLISVYRLFAAILFLAFAVSAGPLPVRAAEEVRFTTIDGFTLAGDFYEGEPGAPAVILLHQLGSERSGLAELARLVNQDGMNALAYDARGHGESVDRDGETVTWRQFDDFQFAEMVRDIEAAVEFLDVRLGGGFRLGLVGASIQSSTALVYAAGDSRVKALVMLSPGLFYRGIDTEAPMSDYSGRPLFMAAGNGDWRSFEAMQTLRGLSGGDTAAFELPGDAHGDGMLDAGPDLGPHVADWLKERLR